MNTLFETVKPSAKAVAIAMSESMCARRARYTRAFPPRQKPAACNLDEVLRTLEESGGGKNH